MFEVHDDFVFSTFKVVLTHLSQTVLRGMSVCVCETSCVQLESRTSKTWSAQVHHGR